MPGGLGVQHPISLDHLGVGIGQQRKLDLAPIREILKYFYAVVADRGQRNALFFEARLSALQLDQLPFAVRSPIGRTEKQEHGAILSFERSETLMMTKLVANGKIRRLRTHRQSDAGEQFDGRHADDIVLSRSVHRDTVSQVASRLILRLQVINLPGGIVIENQPGAGPTILSALGRLRKSLFGGAAAIDDDAGPRAGICHTILRERPPA